MGEYNEPTIVVFYVLYHLKRVVKKLHTPPQRCYNSPEPPSCWLPGNLDSMDIFSLSWVGVFFAVTFAFFVRGVAGFGNALILAPILILIVSPKPVVVINLLLGVVANGVLLPYAFRNMNRRVVMIMAACSLPGIPLGTWVIKIIASSDLKVLIGGLTVFFALLIAFGLTPRFRRERLSAGVAGFLSGVLASATSLGGPPAILFMHNQDWGKEVVHATLAVFFFFGCCFSLAALAISGVVDADTMVTAVSFIPAMLIGLGLGMIAFFRIHPDFFRRLSIAVIVVTGVMGILSGLGVIS